MNNLDHTYTLPTGSTTITRSMLDAIREQKQITHVIIPLGVTSIEEGAFQGCKNLTAITIPDSITEIGEKTFSYCSNLSSITIPNRVTSIEPYTFNYCTSLTSITIPNSVTNIRRAVLQSCESLTSITIPNSVTKIGTYAFCRCFSLTSITIPDSVTNIGDSAFYNCSNLTSITIPDDVTIIGFGTFRGCTSLTSITIPHSVTSIEGHAFEDCYNMRLVIIPTSLERQDTKYWTAIGINLQQTTLITHDQFSNWKSNKILSRTYTHHELAILYQLQKDDNFTPSWPELGKLVSNLMMGDLLEVLPEEKKNIVLPKIYKNISTIDYLQNYSLFSVTQEKYRQEHEHKTDRLENDGFKEYKNPDDPSSTAASSAILSRLTIKEVATLLNVKVSSELRPTLS